MTPEERYKTDATFHALVQVLLAELARGDFTPSELREAIILAATMHEAKTAKLLHLPIPPRMKP